CQHGGDRLRQVGKITSDTIALTDTDVGERLRHARNEAVKLAVAQAPLDAILTPEDQRLGAVAPAQQVLGEIEMRLGDPLRPRHARAIDQRRSLLLAEHAAEIPKLAPELLRVLD